MFFLYFLNIFLVGFSGSEQFPICILKLFDEIYEEVRNIGFFWPAYVIAKPSKKVN